MQLGGGGLLTSGFHPPRSFTGPPAHLPFNTVISLCSAKGQLPTPARHLGNCFCLLAQASRAKSCLEHISICLSNSPEGFHSRTPPPHECGFVGTRPPPSPLSPAYLFRHFPDRLDACPIEVAVVLPSFNELVTLNVLLHLLSRGHEMVVPAIHLILPFGPRGVCKGGQGEVMRQCDLGPLLSIPQPPKPSGNGRGGGKGR